MNFIIYMLCYNLKHISFKINFSFQCHPWVKIVNGKVVSYEPEEEGGCWCGCGSVWCVAVTLNLSVRYKHLFLVSAISVQRRSKKRETRHE